MPFEIDNEEMLRIARAFAGRVGEPIQEQSMAVLRRACGESTAPLDDRFQWISNPTLGSDGIIYLHPTLGKCQIDVSIVTQKAYELPKEVANCVIPEKRPPVSIVTMSLRVVFNSVIQTKRTSFDSA